MEGAIKNQEEERAQERAKPCQPHAVLGGACFNSAGDPFHASKAITEGAYHNGACVQLHRQSMLKQPDSAFEIIEYIFIVIAAVKCS